MTDIQRKFGYVGIADRDIDYVSVTKGNRKTAERFAKEFNELYDLFDNGNDRFMRAVYEHMTAC